MAATIGALHVQCPECGTELPISVQLGESTHDGGAMILMAEPDLTDVVAHLWTHEDC